VVEKVGIEVVGCTVGIVEGALVGKVGATDEPIVGMHVGM
jgi:hypothetical protein